MCIQFLSYQILKNKWVLVLFRVFIVFLITYFNAKYTLCGPKTPNLLSLSEQEIINSFFQWITSCDLPSNFFEGEDALKEYLEPGAIDKLKKDIKDDFISLASKQTHKLENDEIYALRRYAQHLSQQNNQDTSTLIVRKDSEVEVSVLDIVHKYIPKLQNGPLLKNYLDGNDFRNEVKQEIKNFLLHEETQIAKYIEVYRIFYILYIHIIRENKLLQFFPLTKIFFLSPAVRQKTRMKIDYVDCRTNCSTTNIHKKKTAPFLP